MHLQIVNDILPGESRSRFLRNFGNAKDPWMISPSKVYPQILHHFKTCEGFVHKQGAGKLGKQWVLVKVPGVKTMCYLSFSCIPQGDQSKPVPRPFHDRSTTVPRTGGADVAWPRHGRGTGVLSRVFSGAKRRKKFPDGNPFSRNPDFVF